MGKSISNKGSSLWSIITRHNKKSKSEKLSDSNSDMEMTVVKTKLKSDGMENQQVGVVHSGKNASPVDYVSGTKTKSETKNKIENHTDN